MEAGVLVTQPPPRRLGPHHERVHRPLDVDPLLVKPESQSEMYDKRWYVDHPVIITCWQEEPESSRILSAIYQPEDRSDISLPEGVILTSAL